MTVELVLVKGRRGYRPTLGVPLGIASPLARSVMAGHGGACLGPSIATRIATVVRFYGDAEEAI